MAPSPHPPPSYEAQRQTVCLLNCDRGDPRNSRTGPAQRIFARRLHPHSQSISISFSLSLPAAKRQPHSQSRYIFFSPPPPPDPTRPHVSARVLEAGAGVPLAARTSSVRGERASPKPNTTKPQRASPSLSESGRKKAQQGKGLAIGLHGWSARESVEDQKWMRRWWTSGTCWWAAYGRRTPPVGRPYRFR